MALADAAPFAVAAWTLDEASGTRADQVGANDLTDNNTVLAATGMFGDAADFEAGNSEYLSITDNTDLSTGDVDFMVRCWIKVESMSGGTGVICAKGTDVGDGNTCEYGLYTNTSNELNFRVLKAGVGSQTAVWSATLSTGVWYLVHAWHDSVNNVVGIAVDAGTAVTASWSSGANDSTGDFRIGVDGASRHYDGLVDDFVVIKDYILDATERTEDYNSGTGVAFADWAGGGTTLRGRLSLLGVGI